MQETEKIDVNRRIRKTVFVVDVIDLCITAYQVHDLFSFQFDDAGIIHTEFPTAFMETRFFQKPDAF